MTTEALPGGDRYQNARPLGHGGAGYVWRVFDRISNREVALKRLTLSELPDGRRADAELRFRREFHTLARLQHPNIVQAYEYGADPSGPYYTMELLDGEDLQQLAPVGVRTACALLRDVANGLSFLHARRWVHRDLAARNVRRTSAGTAKLIDFGVLATFGMHREVAGTAPYVAPENLRGMPLDARTDLYSLGALAYFLLTGKHAYPVRELESLPEAWRTAPPPIDLLAPGTPSELIRLILSLLSMDPARRPSSCAELVEHLTAIGGLDPVPVGSVARGTLASAPCVGREVELEQFRAGLTRLKTGQGKALVLEAASGMGKSRLLGEMALEAQLAGVPLVRVRAPRVESGPYGMLRAVAEELLRHFPDAAALTGSETAAQVLPTLRSRLRAEQVSAPAGDALEERIHVQRALLTWLTAVAEAHPLALLLDDVQRADESSAAVLAGLALECNAHPLFLVCGVRTDEPARAPEAMSFLARGARRLELKPLDELALRELARGTFGEVRFLDVLAKHLASVSAGSPMAALEAIGQLVDSGTIRFDAGAWELPAELADSAQPASLGELVERQVQRLSPGARALAESLAVHTSDISLALAVALSKLEANQAFAALDELLTAQVLVGGDDRYRFRHDAIREGLERRLEPSRRAALHLHLAETLLAGGEPDADDEEEIGWHLLEGGARERGVDLLDRAGQRLFETHAFADAVPVLRAVLEAKRALGRPPAELLELSYRLLYCGGVVDKASVLENAEAAVYGFAHYAGLDLAKRLSPYLGRSLAVLASLSWAALRWVLTPRSRRGPAPIPALLRFLHAASAATISLSSLMERRKVESFLSLVEPLATSKDRMAYGMYLLMRQQLLWLDGRWHETQEDSREIQRIVRTDRKTPMRDIDRKITEGFAGLSLAAVEAFSLDRAGFEREIAGVEGLGLHMFDSHALQLRGLYHRLRGEEALARRFEAQVDTLALQLGPSWTSIVVRLLYTTLPCVITDDARGLRQCLADVDRLATGSEDSYQVTRLQLTAEHQRTLGRYDEAREGFLALFRAPRERTRWMQGAAAMGLAECYLAQHRYAEAEEWVRAVIERDRIPGLRNYLHSVRMVRAEALCKGGLGQPREGLALLLPAIAEAQRIDNPLVLGLLHEAAARLCVMSADSAALQRHLSLAELAFSRTSHARLIARLRQLSDGGVPTDGSHAHPTPVRSPSVIDTEVTAELFSVQRGPATAALLEGCASDTERFARALEMLQRSVQAVEAYVLSARGEAVSKVAPVDQEPPPLLLGEVARLAPDTWTAGSNGPTPHLGKTGFWLVPLVHGPREGRWIVAALSSTATPDPALVDELVRELEQAQSTQAG